MKKILLVGLFVLIGFDLFSQVPQGLKYEVRGESVTITLYTGNATTLTIPAEIEGLPVTAIERGAFDSCHSLVTITFPSTIREIGDLAFYSCRNLTTINIPPEVEIIRFDMMREFQNCQKLSPATIAALRRVGYTGNF